LTLFSDEAWFHLQGYINTQNNHDYKTINCERYVQDILGQFFPQLEEERLYGWFQQDSATAHTTRISVQALPDVSGGRIISSGIWPARSLDLNPCDFLFWNCLKYKV
jgi:hypothetical protein